MSTSFDVSSLGTVLAVWAHPDDETYLAGGLLAAARDAGQRVVCVSATRGERGGDRPPSELAAVRTAELEAALAVLGVEEHLWLDHPDGGCHLVEPAGPVDQLVALLEDVRPDTVVTFGPDGVTGHADHRAVSAWTSEACRRAGPDVQVLHAAVLAVELERFADLDRRFSIYEVPPPVTDPADLVVDLVLAGAVLERKVRALQAQVSQTEALIQAVGVSRFGAWVAREAFRSPVGAETGTASRR